MLKYQAFYSCMVFFYSFLFEVSAFLKFFYLLLLNNEFDNYIRLIAFINVFKSNRYK